MRVLHDRVARSGRLVVAANLALIAGVMGIAVGPVAATGSNDPALPAHRAALPVPHVGAISGTIANPFGDGVVGLCVSALSSSGVAAAARTDTDGTFALSDVPAGRYRLRVTACTAISAYFPTFYPAVTDTTTGDLVAVRPGQLTDGVHVVVYPTGGDRALRSELKVASRADRPRSGGSISGTVTNSSGHDLAGICVVATEVSRVGFGSSTTKSNGTYTMTRLSAGTYIVEFLSCGGTTSYVTQWYKDEGSSATATPVAVGAGNTPGVNAKMIQAGSISGIVKSGGGAGLSDLCVLADGLGTSSGSAGNALTGSNGGYTITGLAPGSFAVEFENCGPSGNWAPQWYHGQAQYTTSTAVPVTSAHDTKITTAIMQPGGEITGKLTNSSGAGVSGACVYVATDNGADYNYSGNPTGSDGTYTFANLPTDAYSVLYFPGCGSGPADRYFAGESVVSKANPVSVVAGTVTTEVDQTLVTGGSITGRVVNSADTPLSRICVTATSTAVFETAVTTSDGSYILPGLLPTSYTIEFSACGNTGNYAPQWFDGQPSSTSAKKVTVTNETTTPNIDATLETGGILAGTVMNAGSKPESGVCILAVAKKAGFLGGSAFSAPNGRYAISGLDTASYVVSFSIAGCGNPGNLAPQVYKASSSFAGATAVPVKLGKSTTGIDAHLLSGGIISGAVKNTAGSALGGICVKADGSLVSVDTTTEPNGTYAIDGLSSGTYTVSFSTGCGNDGNFLFQYYKGKANLGTASAVRVTAGKLTPGIDATLAAGGTLSGTVTGLGKALLGMCVEADGPAVGTAETSITGAYSVSGLPSGKYAVEVSTTCADAPYGNWLTQYYKGSSSRAAAKLVQVRVGHGVSGVDFAVSGAGTMTGTVTAATGHEALAEICVQAFPVVGGPFDVAITTTNGGFEFVGLQPGTYKVEFTTGCGNTGGYTTQWFRGQSSEASATPVTVKAATNTPGVNAALT